MFTRRRLRPAIGRRAPRRGAPARHASAPASAATVRATRATRARPRPESGTRSTARSSSADAASVRRRTSPSRSRSRRRSTRARTRGGGLARRRSQLLRPRPRHRDDEVEAVEQRSRDLLAIRRDPLRAAAAVGGRVAPASARAQVHRRDEAKAGREERLPADPGDRDDAVLERLPQRLEHGSRKLGQLVEEQDAAVRQARLSGTRRGTAADDRGGRGAVMRRPKRRREDDRTPRRAASRRRSGYASPRAPRPASAAAGCPGGAARASSCPFPAGLRAARCALRRRRARARGDRAPGRAPPRGRAGTAPRARRCRAETANGISSSPRR